MVGVPIPEPLDPDQLPVIKAEYADVLEP